MLRLIEMSFYSQLYSSLYTYGTQKIYTRLQKKFSSNAAAVDAWKVETRLKAKTSFRRAVIRLGFRRTVVQLYDLSKTQNAYNFGHRRARDLYFTYLEMGKKVFIIKFFWHRRDSNPGPRWQTSDFGT